MNYFPEIILLLKNDYIKVFIVSIISVIGAFIPIFILMFGHYLLKKNSYNKLRARLKKEIRDLEKLAAQYEGYIDVHRKRFGFKDSMDIMFNPEIKERIVNDAKDYDSFLRYYHNLKDYRNSFVKKKIKKRSDLNYINNYNFKRYLINLLNDRFPEQYFISEKQGEISEDEIELPAQFDL